MPAVHILINGAGVCPTTPIEDLDADKWDWCMNINLRGAHLCVREAIKNMKKQKYGKIVNISSVAARIGGIASSVSYAASKGGLLSATKMCIRDRFLIPSFLNHLESFDNLHPFPNQSNPTLHQQTHIYKNEQ